MSDRVAVNSPGSRVLYSDGSIGAASATDNVNGTEYPIAKLDLGGPGLSVPVVDALPVLVPGTDVVVTDANANGQFYLTLPAVAGKRNYLTGFLVSGTGATAGSAPYVIITGIAGDIYYVFEVPAGVTNAVQLHVTFPRPLPASAVNLAIQLNIPAFGAGNTLQAATAFGFYR